MNTAEIRRQFLDYFRQHDHEVVPSSNLVPSNDPTLFFTNAGMVQFKDVFLGEESRRTSRATSVQKCLRVSGKHNDLENVGRTPRHHTLFEMLGNFSFGDYFKKDAIKHAWHVLTEVYSIDKNRLWITVFEEDDEALDIWLKHTDVSANRIQKLGAKDNFWSMGETGPCGPCTEIHYDHGPDHGDDENGPAGETDRYVEVWNLVFMQYNRDKEGVLSPLPNPSIDTGMGLERIAAIKQGVYSNYDTDLFQAIISDTAKNAGISYGDSTEEDVALQVIADHARATAFLISDGVMPSNEGRGYVLRRIMRRAIRFGVRLGLKEPFLGRAAGVVIDEMQLAYPNLSERRTFVEEVILGEEKRFSETLEKGLGILEAAFEEMKEGESLSGKIIFQLHDTYGFPMDLTALIAKERGHVIDEEGYHTHMAAQKEAGRANWKGTGEIKIDAVAHELASRYQTKFKGYTQDSVEAKILSLLNDRGMTVSGLNQGETGIALLSETAFYAEGGGQIGDRGHLISNEGIATVSATTKPIGEAIHHAIKIESGRLSVNQVIKTKIDIDNRRAVERNHSATHLLHAALRNILGEHVVQKGSLVEGQRLRFDFSHHKAVSKKELKAIEQQVQSQIFKNTQLETTNCTMDEAKANGAMALFGEKYGDTVRVVSIPDYSIELCGGCHVDRTGDIGIFHITSESGIAAGVRRIEALTGHKALKWLNNRANAALSASKELKTAPDNLVEAVSKIIGDKKRLERELEKIQNEMARASAGDLSEKAKTINGVKVIAAEMDADPKMLREEADRLRNALGTAVVVLGTRKKNVQIMVAVTKDIAGKRVHAGNLIRDLARMVGGGGGGRPDMAQAGGKNPDGLPAALESVYEKLADI